MKPRGGIWLLMALLTTLAGAGLAMAHVRVRERIIYTSLRPIDHALYLFASASEPPMRLSAVPALDYNPTFSPDGRWLVFCLERRGNPDLYALDLHDQARTPRLINDSDALEDAPAFSPDGTWLVFTSQRGGLNDEEPLITIFNPQPYGEIHAVRLADGLVVRLTHNKWEDGTPTWAAIPGE